MDNLNPENIEKRPEVLVVYDKSDLFTDDHLLLLLLEKKITFITLYDTPGRTVSQILKYMCPFPLKVLIILSIQLCHNEKLKFFLDNILEKAIVELESKDKLLRSTITFVTTGILSNKYGFDLLLKTKIIYKTENYSIDLLLEELQCDTCSFCTVISRGFHNDIDTNLLLHGLSLQHLNFEICGLLISTEPLCVKIDLKGFQQYRKFHQYLKTCEILEKQGISRNCSTKVAIQLYGNTEQYYPLIPDIVSICASVIDVPEPEANLQSLVNSELVTSIAGKLERDEENFLKDLYHKVWYGMSYKRTSQINQPYFTEFQNVEERIASFPSEWIQNEEDSNCIEKIANAGFFYYEPGANARCFSCASVLTNIRLHKNPILKHASLHPGCKYIKSLLTEHELEKGASLFNNRKDMAIFAKALEEKYATFDSRRETFNLLKHHNKKIFDIDELAEAGFFYVGCDTLFQCYKCCVRLFDIREKESAWAMHTLLSPNCTHIKNCENKKLISAVISTKRAGICPDVTIITLQGFLPNQEKRSEEVLFRPW